MMNLSISLYSIAHSSFRNSPPFSLAKTTVGAMMEEMEQQTDFQRLVSILLVLNELTNTDEFRILNADGFALLSDVKDNDRLNLVFNHVKTNFKEEISLEEVADLASMTVPSFCRYFKKITSKTFTQFVNEYRLVHASKLLAETFTNRCIYILLFKELRVKKLIFIDWGYSLQFCWLQHCLASVAANKLHTISSSCIYHNRKDCK